jgi:hypothetical protein
MASIREKLKEYWLGAGIVGMLAIVVPIFAATRPTSPAGALRTACQEFDAVAPRIFDITLADVLTAGTNYKEAAERLVANAEAISSLPWPEPQRSQIDRIATIHEQAVAVMNQAVELTLRGEKKQALSMLSRDLLPLAEEVDFLWDRLLFACENSHGEPERQ